VSAYVWCVILQKSVKIVFEILSSLTLPSKTPSSLQLLF
jgi:hypothetical protein